MDSKEFGMLTFALYCAGVILVLFGNISGCVYRLQERNYTKTEEDRVVGEYIVKGVGWPLISAFGAYRTVFQTEWVEHKEPNDGTETD